MGTQTRNFGRRRGGASLLWGCGVGAALCVASATVAQPLVITSRQGSGTAYCGRPGIGPLVQHGYTIGTTQDSISVSDPGGTGGTNYPASGAIATMIASATDSAISIEVHGTASRGPQGGAGVYATADMRDVWQFEVAHETCFAFRGACAMTSSDGWQVLQAYSLNVLGPGQIVLDPGVPANSTARSTFLPGSISSTATGRLLPGRYYVQLFGRCEGNSFPWSGTFDGSLSLTLSGAAIAGQPESATACNGGAASFSVTPGSSGPFTYAWQIRLPGDAAWVNLQTTPTALPCGGTAVAGSPGASQTSVRVTGCLGVSEYRVRCVVGGVCGSVTSQEAVMLLCRADFNCDGSANPDDLGDFITCYFTEPPCTGADFNGDGNADPDDLGDFITNYFGGVC